MKPGDQRSSGFAAWGLSWQGHSRGPCKLLLLGALMVLSEACVSPVENLMKNYTTQGVNPTSFNICLDYGCYRRTHVRLSSLEWGEVRGLFEPPAESATEERNNICKAIALLEKFVGKKTGTTGDLPKSPVLLKAGGGQLDCIDEAYNTTLYLLLLQRDGLITWHDVGQPVRRGYLIDCYPHNTATIIERASGEQFAVDSWFHANGELPEIVPIHIWLACWKPED